MKKIVLASKSPRRKELLTMLGLSFDIMGTDAPEDIEEGMHPSDAVRELSKRKAIFAKEALENRGALSEQTLIIAADTVVAKDAVILGKPCDREDAYNMLRSLSGGMHTVYSGFTLVLGDRTYSESTETRVFFRELTDSEIYRYIDGYSPFDKAGAYGIQEFAGVFAEKIEGDINNVIGLPVCALEMAMRRELSSSLFEF